jgi:hypothetical protein
MIARTMKPLVIVALILCSALTLTAQLPTPNADGVSAGHHIIRAKDVDVANKFWTTLGGSPAALATIKLMKFPGVLLYISAPRRRRQGLNQHRVITVRRWSSLPSR